MAKSDEKKADEQPATKALVPQKTRKVLRRITVALPNGALLRLDQGTAIPEDQVESLRTQGVAFQGD